MRGFSDGEFAYLLAHDLARLATAGAGGTPHVVPVRIHLQPDRGMIAVGSRMLPEGVRPRRYRADVRSNPEVSLVVDDFTEEGPRGVLVQGVGRVHSTGGERLKPGYEPVWVEIMPLSVASWGIDSGAYEPPRSRPVDAGTFTAP
ncbi:pyridoxamine 5'-phosphate oxidase family protein [Nonomuraea sp. NPDC049607]|uniref:pyridoxamine 5'-phosphate oxidase family protein n=1 Tax=unclassified Nonomuraea TaxID=2593643 RepID=UPI00344A8295